MNENAGFKDIPGYEGLYEVSTLGEVRSKRTQKLLKPFDNRGYERVGLVANGSRKKYLVHRLVASAFIANPNGLKEINHINANKKCNTVENLEWSDRIENMRHAKEANLCWGPSGEKSHLSKITEHDVRQIRKLIELGNSDVSIAQMFGVSDGCVHGIKHGKTWRHVV